MKVIKNEKVRMAVVRDIIIELTISEPLDVYRVLKGKIVRPIELLGEDELYYLFQDDDGKWLLIKPRYIDEQIEEVYLGKRVQVVIAALIDQNVINSDFFRVNQVDYFGVGTITKL